MSTATALTSLWLSTPAIAFLFSRHALRPGAEPLVFLLACITSYGFLLCSLPFREAEIEAAMLVFDLDGDGVVGSDEMSVDAQIAVDRWQHDTGRSFAPFTGISLTPVWAGIVYLLFWLISAFGSLARGLRNAGYQ